MLATARSRPAQRGVFGDRSFGTLERMLQPGNRFGIMEDVDLEHRPDLRVLLAEQAFILLLCGGAMAFFVRRERRRTAAEKTP